MPHILLSHQGDRGDIHEGPDQEEEEEEEEEGGKGELVEGEDLRDDQRHLEKSRTKEEDERSLRHSKLPFCQQAPLFLG